MNASNVRTSSQPAAGAPGSSTLRPRPNRLISGLSEGDGTSFDPQRDPTRSIPSPLLSPWDSRPASPLPSPHPQRPSGSGYLSQRTAGDGRARKPAQLGGQSRSRTESPNPLAGLWGSWGSTLQGLASELMGNDASAGEFKDKTGRQRRPVSRLDAARSGSPAKRGGQWGPTTLSSQPASVIGTGTREEREAAVRAEKRKNLLQRGDSSYADAMGKYKRRLSDDFDSASAPPAAHDDRSALVYLHHVKKDDTLAGITIKYNISANMLRKANRMWPNDTAQSRNTLMLPVTSCGIKGRPVPSAQPVDLLTAESESLSAGLAEEVETPKAWQQNGKGVHSRAHSASSSAKGSSTAASNADVDQPWHHDSWVLLDGNSQPTEIARLSKRAVSYFPPARRKSISFSDSDTPATSLDLARVGSSSGGVDAKAPEPRPSARTRRPSNAESGYYPAYMAGPGGVGTMNKNVHFPGPAQDGLNKMFAKYLTDVAPPRQHPDLLQPEVPLYSDEATTPTSSRPGTPGGARIHPTNLNIENVGGQIESWMRRVASQAKQSMATTDRGRAPRGPRASVGAPGRGADGVGDLIEMTNEFEIGGDDDDDLAADEEEGRRGRRGSEIYVGQQRAGPSGSSGYFVGAPVRDRKRNKAD